MERAKQINLKNLVVRVRKTPRSTARDTNINRLTSRFSARDGVASKKPPQYRFLRTSGEYCLLISVAP